MRRERILTPPSLIEQYQTLLGKNCVIAGIECFYDHDEERYYHDVYAKPNKNDPFKQLSFKVKDNGHLQLL